MCESKRKRNKRENVMVSEREREKKRKNVGTKKDAWESKFPYIRNFQP